MKVVVVAKDPQALEIAMASVRLIWPDASLRSATTGRKGLELIRQERPTIVLLRPGFSEISLSAVIEDLRRFSEVPLLVLGNQGDEQEAITSLESGADDYVRLPCDLTELATRIWALLRRAGSTLSEESGNRLTSGQLTVNPATYEAFIGEQRLSLTTTEFRMIHLLMKNWGIAVAHQTLAGTLGKGKGDSYGLVKRWVQRLRYKLGDDAKNPHWVANVHGIGYRFIGPTPRP